tara:strand:+ start:140 stop:1612 length:1473 start_codon:yes stop_codon:yes gene_type:complete
MAVELDDLKIKPEPAKMSLIGRLPGETPPTTRGQDIVIGTAKALIPDLTDPKEAAEYFVDLFGHAKAQGPAKGALTFAGKRLIKEIPAVKRGLDTLSSVKDEVVSNVARNLNIRRPAYATAGADNVNAMKIDQRLEGFDTTRVERGKIRTEEITRQRQIQEAELKKQANLDIGKKNRADSNIREKRGRLGTPTDFSEKRAKEWIASNPDPRIRERLGKAEAYGKPIGDVAHKKGEYPRFHGDKQNKAVNNAIKKNLGLEYTVEQHHLIHLRDSATIGKHLDDLNDPITKAATYDYMMKRFGIVPGNFDLNIANIPAGPHRLGVGGDLHTWLDRLGYEDYWGDFSKKWAGKTPNSTDILDAFDLYMDEVFHPMMVKLDDLVKKNPTKGKFEGAYVPEYLVDEAKDRIKHLQTPNRPQNIRGSKAGADQAIEAQMDQAFDAGLGDRGAYYQEKVGDTTITGRRHYRSPDQKKVSAKELQIKRKKDRLSIANN